MWRLKCAQQNALREVSSESMCNVCADGAVEELAGELVTWAIDADGQVASTQDVILDVRTSSC